jgi:hypothetical protein
MKINIEITRKREDDLVLDDNQFILRSSKAKRLGKVRTMIVYMRSFDM